MSKRDRLLQKINEVETRWQRLSVRLGKLKLARELETRVEEHMRMDALIERVDADQAAVGTELETLETHLTTLSSGAASAMSESPNFPSLIYWSYAHSDELLRDELARNIEALSAVNGPQQFHDRRVPLGKEPDRVAAQQLGKARVILLLVSADYLADARIDRNEVQPAMLRYAAGDAVVIPIILRACTWEDAPFAKLQVLPKDGVPVQSWPDRELVLRDIAARVHSATGSLTASRQ